MKEIVTNGMRFNGMGYVVLARNQLGLRPKKTDIQLQFQTFSESGLLLYMSDYKRDFLSIELKDGRVVFQYDLGGGSVAMESQDKLNDGEWHSIVISRSQQQGLLRVDNEIGQCWGGFDHDKSALGRFWSRQVSVGVILIMTSQCWGPFDHDKSVLM